MTKCEKCERKFPDHLINTVTVGGYGKTMTQKEVCPMCALAIGNEACGVDRKNFDGPKAQKMLEEAREYVATKEKA